MPTNSAVREMLPPNRLIWATKYSRSNTSLAERIAVMHHGALLAVDTPEAVMRDETVQRAYVGEPL